MSAVEEAEQVVRDMLIREHAIRGSFSAIAAAALLYMASEYGEYAILRGKKEAWPIALVCLGLAVMEGHKVGSRVERILGLHKA